MNERERNEFGAVWGAKAIGAEINRGPRQALHLLETGVIPARKVGRLWVAERSKLRYKNRGETKAEWFAAERWSEPDSRNIVEVRHVEQAMKPSGKKK